MDEFPFTCSDCSKKIGRDESYFQGTMYPPLNTGKFGCAPYIIYCGKCSEQLPTFFNPRKKKKGENA
jgi:hypothetical protein